MLFQGASNVESGDSEKRRPDSSSTGSKRDPDRFYCPYEGCNRSFAELWRLKVHYRAAPNVRGSGKERGHGAELQSCPKCGAELKPGRHHVGCAAGKQAAAQQERRRTLKGRKRASCKDTTPSTVASSNEVEQTGQDAVHVGTVAWGIPVGAALPAPGQYMPLDFDQFFHPMQRPYETNDPFQLMPYGDSVNSMVWGNQGEVPTMAMAQMDSDFEMDFFKFFNDPHELDPFTETDLQTIQEDAMLSAGGYRGDLLPSMDQKPSEGLEPYLRLPEMEETSDLTGKKRERRSSLEQRIEQRERKEHSRRHRYLRSPVKAEPTEIKKTEGTAESNSHYITEDMAFDRELHNTLLPRELPMELDHAIDPVTHYPVERGSEIGMLMKDLVVCDIHNESSPNGQDSEDNKALFNVPSSPLQQHATGHPKGSSAIMLTVVSLLLLASISQAAIPVKTKTIIGVGGSGSYDEVVSMPCAGGTAPSCQRRPKSVSGCLAPFDEEQTLKLRGPMDISEIGVWYPTGSSWGRVSYYNSRGAMDNIVFMGNYGRSMDGHDVDESSCHTMPGEQAKYIVNGDDFMCHGYNTSYVSPNGKCAAKKMGKFMGKLDDTVEVNIMQRATCESGGCGYYRGMGHRGWDGNRGSKMFAIRLRYTRGSMYDAPALWFLHGSVLRTANYHAAQLCNCRGVGSPGGCGELDIAEVVTEKNQKEEVETTIYSFKGAYSDQNAYKFERVMGRDIVYVVIFNAEGYIQILQLDPSEFKFDGSLSNAFVNRLNSKRELIMKMPGSTMPGCGGPVCDYMYSMDGGFAARIEDGVVCQDVLNQDLANPNPRPPPFGRKLKLARR